jgi:hypothetical protein
MAQSTATDRKIRIIEAALGADWRTLHEGWSIDRIYNHVQGDDRKNLFCKVQGDIKAKLDEMVVEYDVDMAVLISQMIEAKHADFLVHKSTYTARLASQFAE